MNNLFIIVNIASYILPLLLINLNSYGAYKNNKRFEEGESEYHIGYTILFTVMSFVPIINIVLALVLPLLDRDSVYLTSYHKNFNIAYRCYKCGNISRAGYSNRFKIYKDWIGNYKVDDGEIYCSLCESANYHRESQYDKKNLPNGKKINIFKSSVISMRGNYSKVTSQLMKLERKQAELEFMDEQLAIRQRIEELKLKKFQEERMKLEENENVQNW